MSDRGGSAPAVLSLRSAAFGYDDRPAVSDVDPGRAARRGRGAARAERLGQVDAGPGPARPERPPGRRRCRCSAPPSPTSHDHARLGYVPQRHTLSASVRATVAGGRRHRPAAAPGLARAAERPRPGRRRPGARARRPRRPGLRPTSARSPAASSAGCSSPARSRPSPTSSSWTSRPPASTPPTSRCSRRGARPASPRAARRWSSSRTSSAALERHRHPHRAWSAAGRSPSTARRRTSPARRAPTPCAHDSHHHDPRPRPRPPPHRRRRPPARSTGRRSRRDRAAHLRLHAAGPARGPARRRSPPRMVGIFLVQRRLSLIGDGMGHVALAGVAVGRAHRRRARCSTALVAAVVAAVVDRADPRPGPHQRRRRPGGASSTAASPPASSSSASRPAARRPTSRRTSSAPSPRRSRGDLWVFAGARRRSSSARPGLLRPRLFAVANDEEYARATRDAGPALNIALAVLTAVTVVVAMRVVGPAAHQRADDRAQRRGQLLAGSFRAAIRVGRRSSACVSSVGGVAASFYADTPSGGTIVLLAIAVFVAQRRSPPGSAAGVTPRHHREAERHEHEHGAECGHPAVAARRPRRLPPRRAPPRRPRGSLRRARRRPPTATAGAAPTSARDPAHDDGEARRDRTDRARPRAADPAAGRRGRRCSSDTDDFTSAQDLHARLRERRARRSAWPRSTAPCRRWPTDGEVDVLRTDDGEAVYRALQHRRTTTTWSAAPAGAPSRSRARRSSGGPTRSAPSTGSSTSRHTLEIFGTCADCAARGR